MPLQNVVQAIIGDIHPWGPSAFDSHLLDAAGEKAAYAFQIPKSGNITHVGFRTGAVTTAEDLRVGLETLFGGVPSTTQYGGSAVGVQTAPAANTYYEVALATPAAAVRGDFVASVVQFDSATGNLNISAGSPTGNHDFPYQLDFTAGAWNKYHRIGICSIKYDDGTYGKIFSFPAATLVEDSFASDTSPDELGLKFKVTTPIVLQGVYARVGANASSTFDIVIYDEDGTTALDTTSVFQSNLKGSGNNFKKFIFPDPVPLKAGTFYRLVFKPTNTVAMQLYRITVNAAGVLDGFAGGQDFHLTSRTDAGAWTDTTTARPFIGLIIEQLQDGSVYITCD